MPQGFGRLFFVNLFIFILWGIVSLLSQIFPNNIFLRFFESLTILTVIFVLPGLNLTLTLEKLAKQHFDLFERLTIVALFSIIIPPLFLLGEYTVFHTLFPALPLFNAVITFLIAIILCPFSLEKSGLVNNNFEFLKEYFFSAFSAALIFLLVIIATVSAYYPLPESDPYYWFNKIQHEITTGLFPTGESYRPLFSYLVYLFTVTAKIDLYAFFKYVMPCFLLLTIFPTSLFAKRLTHSFERLVLHLLPLSSASIVIYFLFPIPQAIINLILTFFVFLSLHAIITKNHFFSFLAGVSLLIGYLYHDIALLFFFPWLLTTLIFWRKHIWQQILTHKLATIALIIFSLPYYPAISPVLNFFKNWLVRVFSTIEYWKTNFSFPLSYVNIDGRAVGWGNYFGAIKYYLFYGSPILMITVILLCLFVFSSKRREQFLRTYQSPQEIIILILVFLTFFSLAEILPRFFGIALLPERALSFTGLISISIIPLAYPLISFKWRSYIIWLLFIALMINVGAALYINSLKKDLISPMKIASMQWIKNTLPPNRVIIVQHDLTVMKTFSQTESILEIPHENLYTDITVFNQLLGQLSTPSLSTLHTTYREYLDQNKEQFNHLRSLDPRIPRDIPAIKTELEDFMSTTSHLLHQFPSGTLKEESLPSKTIYIYYAKQGGQNLYASRPYYKSEQTIDNFTFDTDKRFIKIYNDQENQIFIWKFNPFLP